MAVYAETLEYETPYVRLYQGDSRHLPLEDGSVSCVVTSPPYMGLRKYAGEQELVWDEPAEGCEHVWGEPSFISVGRHDAGDPTSTAGIGRAAIDYGGDKSASTSTGQFCQRCNAWRGAFGLEPTPQLYIQHLMVFMEDVWRVLRPDGCVFLNLGDSYNGSGGAHQAWHMNPGMSHSADRNGYAEPAKVKSIRPKSLMLIPERFALACQERGWIVRSRIVWAKPNPMPESVTDRPTDAWEHIWMLTKSERYWWDQEAVREPHTEVSIRREEYEHRRNGQAASKSSEYGMPANVVKLNPNGRNLRNVWTIATEPYADAHFAVCPTAIPERCILAACPPAICTACGKPRERIVERTPGFSKDGPKTVASHVARGGTGIPTGTVGQSGSGRTDGTSQTLGWSDCGCGAGWIPGLVLDPFSGSGTTAMVAQQLGRRAVGVDMSADYIEMARRRLEATPLPMALEL